MINCFLKKLCPLSSWQFVKCQVDSGSMSKNGGSVGVRRYARAQDECGGARGAWGLGSASEGRPHSTRRRPPLPRLRSAPSSLPLAARRARAPLRPNHNYRAFTKTKNMFLWLMAIERPRRRCRMGWNIFASSFRNREASLVCDLLIPNSNPFAIKLKVITLLHEFVKIRSITALTKFRTFWILPTCTMDVTLPV